MYKHILCIRTINCAVNVSNRQKDNQEDRCHPSFFKKFFSVLHWAVVIICLCHMINVKELEISPRVNRYIC